MTNIVFILNSPFLETYHVRLFFPASAENFVRFFRTDPVGVKCGREFRTEMFRIKRSQRKIRAIGKDHNLPGKLSGGDRFEPPLDRPETGDCRERALRFKFMLSGGMESIFHILRGAAGRAGEPDAVFDNPANRNR